MVVQRVCPHGGQLALRTPRKRGLYNRAPAAPSTVELDTTYLSPVLNYTSYTRIRDLRHFITFRCFNGFPGYHIHSRYTHSQLLPTGSSIGADTTQKSPCD